MKRFLALSALLALCGLSMIGCGGGTGIELFPPIRRRERFSSPERMRRFHPW